MDRFLPYFFSALIGALVWIVIGAVVDTQEAWDSPVYFTVGLPVMALSVITVSGIWPSSPWRWAVFMVLPQAVAMFCQGYSSLNLWPLTLAMFFVLVLVLNVVAYLGSIIRKRVIEKNAA